MASNTGPNKNASNGPQGLPGSRPVVPAKNPYASKRKRPSNDTLLSDRSGSTASSTSTRHGGVLGASAQQHQQQKQRSTVPSVAAAQGGIIGMQASTGSTFSQAFGSIEDTEYYQNSLADLQQQNHDPAAAAAMARAEQRAFEKATTAETDMPVTLSDRDNHVFLQPHALSVSYKQRGNGVLNYIRNVPYEYGKIVPDFIMTTTSCALFLSCKYHALHPQYIHRRIAELKTDFKLRILLVLVDVEDNAATLLFLNKLSVLHNFTLILAWTEEEAARYLESYKALDGNDASVIQRKEKTNFVDQAIDFLAGASGVNKTDAASLLTQFTSIRAIMAASKDEIALVPGMGQVKVTRLHDAFHKPFSTKRQRERRKRRAEEEAEAALDAVEPKAETDKEMEEPKSDDNSEPLVTTNQCERKISIEK